jgi:hypothetical protein
MSETKAAYRVIPAAMTPAEWMATGVKERLQQFVQRDGDMRSYERGLVVLELFAPELTPAEHGEMLETLKAWVGV